MQRSAGVAHARTGGYDHAVSREVEAAPHVEAVSEGTEGGIESADGLVRVGAQEEPGSADPENVAGAVVLALVDVAFADAFESARAGGGEDSQLKEPTPIPAELLDTDGRDGLSDGCRAGEFAEAPGFGRAVVVEDPPPLVRGEGAPLGLRPADGVAEVACAPHANNVSTLGKAFRRKWGHVPPSDIDDGHGVRHHRLLVDGPQDGLDERRVSPSDEDRSDRALEGAQPAIRRRRRLSRSDMPPQMPKRSSLARAYSRHSSRTWQA